MIYETSSSSSLRALKSRWECRWFKTGLLLWGGCSSSTLPLLLIPLLLMHVTLRGSMTSLWGLSPGSTLAPALLCSVLGISPLAELAGASQGSSLRLSRLPSFLGCQAYSFALPWFPQMSFYVSDCLNCSRNLFLKSMEFLCCPLFKRCLVSISLQG